MLKAFWIWLKNSNVTWRCLVGAETYLCDRRVCQNIFYFDSLLCPAHRELGSVPKHQKQEMSLPLLTFLFSEHCPLLETPRTGSSIYFWGPLQRCEISFFEVTRVVEAVQQNLDDSPKIIIAILPKLYMNLQKSKLLQIIPLYVNIPPINPKFQTLATVGHIHPNFPAITEN